MPDRTSILVLDDDVELARTLAEHIEEDGKFVVTLAHTIGDAQAKLDAQEGGFDAFILDVGLPDGDGRDLCARWRAQDVQVPIIMLTGMDDEVDVVRGLDVGANDYVAKPFRTAVLMARLRSHLREHENSMHTEIPIGPYMFRPADKVLVNIAQKKRIKLTEKEAKILRFLSRTPEKGVSSDKLLAEVWGYSENAVTHTLETHIYRLRQKIEVNPKHPRIIRSGSGGYSLHPKASDAAIANMPAAAGPKQSFAA